MPTKAELMIKRNCKLYKGVISYYMTTETINRNNRLF